MKVDAFHSFQDSILPVGEFVRRYGSDVGTIGGIDVDFICNASTEALRDYVLSILDRVQAQGRYVLGTGNSVTDYVPYDAWCTVLDIVREYSES